MLSENAEKDKELAHQKRLMTDDKEETKLKRLKSIDKEETKLKRVKSFDKEDDGDSQETLLHWGASTPAPTPAPRQAPKTRWTRGSRSGDDGRGGTNPIGVIMKTLLSSLSFFKILQP